MKQEIILPSEAKTLDDLCLDTLKDNHNAEKQILKALPKMAKAANARDRKQAFRHL